MKKLKLLTATLLIASILLSVCPQVFAYTVNWITQNPIVSESVYEFGQNGIIIKKNGVMAFFAPDGSALVPFEKGYTTLSQKSNPNCGYLLAIDAANRASVIDYSGNVAVPAERFEHIKNIVTGGKVVVGRKTGTEGVYEYAAADFDGNIIIPYGLYAWISPTEHGTYIVQTADGSKGVIGTYGETIIPVGNYWKILPTASPYRYVAVDQSRLSYLFDNAGNVIKKFQGQLCEYELIGDYFSFLEESGYVVYDLNGIATNKTYVAWSNSKIYDAIVKAGINNVIRGNNGFTADAYGNYMIVRSEHNGEPEARLMDINGNVIFGGGEGVFFDKLYDDKYVEVRFEKDGTTAILDINGNYLTGTSKEEKCLIHYLGNDMFLIGPGYYYGAGINKFLKIEGEPGKPAFPGHSEEAEAPAVNVIVDSLVVEFIDQAPVIVEGRTLLPLRMVFELLGATVDWNGDTQTVTAVKDGVTVTITIGSNKLYVNGEAKTLDVPAQIMNERTMVPVRAASEAFGCNVGWDAATSTVTINTK